MPKITDADRIFAGNKWITEVKYNGQSIWTSPTDLGPGSTVITFDAAASRGYFGIVSAAHLISGDALATALSLTAGTGQNSDAGWLKFWMDTGDVMYIAKKPIRHSISRADIAAVYAVDGTATVTIGGRNYDVWLIESGTGGADVITDTEFYNYFYKTYDGTWASYSLSELGCGAGDNGRYAWMSDYDGFYYYLRGVLSRVRVTDNTSNSSDYGWRPMLKLVQT